MSRPVMIWSFKVKHQHQHQHQQEAGSRKQEANESPGRVQSGGETLVPLGSSDRKREKGEFPRGRLVRYLSFLGEPFTGRPIF